ncbi:hypothetical protein C8J56DRAFT_1050510 [Mycena floridula]|nr:hypothetical protein C8J56DRAFT_1050510 [Mycena floridula]
MSSITSVTDISTREALARVKADYRDLNNRSDEIIRRQQYDLGEMKAHQRTTDRENARLEDELLAVRKEFNKIFDELEIRQRGFSSTESAQPTKKARSSNYMADNAPVPWGDRPQESMETSTDDLTRLRERVRSHPRSSSEVVPIAKSTVSLGNMAAIIPAMVDPKITAEAAKAAWVNSVPDAFNTPMEQLQVLIQKARTNEYGTRRTLSRMQKWVAAVTKYGNDKSIISEVHRQFRQWWLSADCDDWVKEEKAQKRLTVSPSFMPRQYNGIEANMGLEDVARFLADTGVPIIQVDTYVNYGRAYLRDRIELQPNDDISYAAMLERAMQTGRTRTPPFERVGSVFFPTDPKFINPERVVPANYRPMIPTTSTSGGAPAILNVGIEVSPPAMGENVPTMGTKGTSTLTNDVVMESPEEGVSDLQTETITTSIPLPE